MAVWLLPTGIFPKFPFPLITNWAGSWVSPAAISFWIEATSACVIAPSPLMS